MLCGGGGGRQSRFKPGHDGTCSPGRKRGGWEQGLLGRGWGGTGGSGGSGGRPSAPSLVITPGSQCTPPSPSPQRLRLRPHSRVRPSSSPVPHIPRGAQGQGPPTCGCPAGPDPAQGGADLGGTPVCGVCPSPGRAGHPGVWSCRLPRGHCHQPPRGPSQISMRSSPPHRHSARAPSQPLMGAIPKSWGQSPQSSLSLSHHSRGHRPQFPAGAVPCPRGHQVVTVTASSWVLFPVPVGTIHTLPWEETP